MKLQVRASAVPAASNGRLFRRRSGWPQILGGMAALLVVVALAVATGTVAIPIETIVRMSAAKLPGTSVVPDWPASFEAVLWQIRLPRVVLAGMVGAALAVSGGTYQALFRNPLADPYLIGVAAGASLGAVLAIVATLPPILYGLGAVQAAAFVGATITVAAVYGLARVGRSTPITTLLLAGVALGAFASAITSFLMYVHGDKLISIYSWLLGGFALSNWQNVALTTPSIAIGTAVICLNVRRLNVLQLDDDQAAHLGLNVERLKLVLIVAATLTTSAAVAVSGLIGFVGLIVPHAVRLLVGSDYRVVIPMSLVAGAGFLILADTLGRASFGSVELPVGVVTAFCGAPFFLYLLRQNKRMVF